MEVGQGPNWGCSAKEKQIQLYTAEQSSNKVNMNTELRILRN
jgi:hypothetical protein